MTVNNVAKHEQWTASAPTLTDAFAFVMEHVDQFPEPNIQITARRWYSGDIAGPDMEAGPTEQDFEVTVSGTTDA